MDKAKSTGAAINAGAESKHKPGQGQALAGPVVKTSPIPVPSSPIPDDKASKDMQPPAQSPVEKDELASKRTSTGSSSGETSALVTQNDRMMVLDKITKLCSMFVDEPTKQSQ